ncbi:hypothetical protein OsJ_08989 [Oryza sativa Japonica Group]|uniref:Uncharacterized protein n=2 Tax=Oryza sativa subsp. japonica TaxID=39947 RepID=B9F4P1_ORYSJ|nr:hypothetical protein OsJ_08989 [Oryza sativa Japonica Group]
MEADEQQQRTSTRWKGRRKTLVLVVEEEKRMDCITTYLLFNINIKDMFTHDDEWTVLRPLPRPMAQMDTLRRLALEYLNFAVVASNTIVGVSNRKRTVLLDLECDATADVLSPGPELPEEIIGGTVLIPLGTGVYAIGNRPCRRSPTFQLLLPPSRREGDWELPIDGRGVFVPELGLCPRLRCLCAFDLPTATAPPVVRYVWPETFSEELNAMGVRAGNPWQLGLPGTMGIQHDHRRVPTRFALLLIAVQLQRDDKEEFCLVSRKLRCYDLPANAKKCLPAAYLATVRLLVTVGAEVTSNKLTHWFARQMIRFISQCTELARDLVALARIRVDVEGGTATKEGTSSPSMATQNLMFTSPRAAKTGRGVSTVGCDSSPPVTSHQSRGEKSPLCPQKFFSRHNHSSSHHRAKKRQENLGD